MASIKAILDDVDGATDDGGDCTIACVRPMAAAACSFDNAPHGNAPRGNAPQYSRNTREAAHAAATVLLPGDSHWDRLSPETARRILLFASPYTRLINGLLGLARLDEKERLGLWRDVLAHDWPGDLGLLPEVKLEYPDMAGVCSRSMYHRLCARFPKQADVVINTLYDRTWNFYDVDYETSLPGDMRLVFQLRHIPMHNGWFDLVDLSYPIALGWYSIVFGHTEMLRHLAHTLRLVDLARFNRAAVRSLSAEFVAIDVAADDGYLEIVQMLHHAGNNACTKDAMRRASASGHLHVIKWLHENRREGCSTDAMDAAAKNGHLHVIQFLHTHRTEGCTKNAMDSAAAHGHLHVVRWLHENRHEGCTTDAMDKAAMYGHLDVVRWLHDNRKEGCTSEALTWAASYGHIAVVIYLITQCGEVPSKQRFIAVAKAGNLQMVKCLMQYLPVSVITPDWIGQAFAQTVGRKMCTDVAQFLADHVRNQAKTMS